jgi:hypothetical protein
MTRTKTSEPRKKDDHNSGFHKLTIRVIETAFPAAVKDLIENCICIFVKAEMFAEPDCGPRYYDVTVDVPNYGLADLIEVLLARKASVIDAEMLQEGF